MISSNLAINGMMFVLALCSIILFIVWLCRVSAQEAPQKQALLLGISLLMINLYFSTQTSRQFIATILLLFAITEKSLFIRFALLALASAFHITSIPFFIIYVLGQRWRYGWLAVLGLAAVLRFYFENLLALIGVLPAAIKRKRCVK